MTRFSPVIPALAAALLLSLMPAPSRGADDKPDDKSDKKSQDAKTDAKTDAKPQDSDAQQAASASKPDAEGFIPLFNGKDLSGWEPNERPQTFKVQDGNIVVNGERAHLFYVGPVHNHEWKNFHFKAEVMTFPNSNSGIYFHTKPQGPGWPAAGFECQVNNTFKTDPRKTGGLYAVKDVMNTAPVGDNEWFTYDIIVKGNHVQLQINGKTTADWTQPADWKHDEFAGRRIGSGTFALQGHDPGSKVMFRNIRVKALD
jgi:hypothetical protein